MLPDQTSTPSALTSRYGYKRGGALRGDEWCCSARGEVCDREGNRQINHFVRSIALGPKQR